MASLIYSAICSVDGFVNDEQGNFDWASPDEQVHAFVNDQEREVGTYLYGARMYRTMRFWQDAHLRIDPSPVTQDYAAIWQRADKIVYSSSLRRVNTERTRLEREFDADAVRALVVAGDRPFSIGGATLAATALGAGLVDEVRLFRVPVEVGGGTAALSQGAQEQLEQVDAHTFDSGVGYTRYRIVR